jgi:putative acetyltransferase
MPRRDGALPAVTIRAERPGGPSPGPAAPAADEQAGVAAPADRQAIFAVHAAAFPTDAEARLVDALRAAGKARVSLVAEVGGAIAGHVLFSPVAVEISADGWPGAGLAPLAVRPTLQRRGIGGLLVESGLEACRRAGFGFVVVLGEPRYYGRFGFRRARDLDLRSEYGADEEFMARELCAGGLAGVTGLVRYAPEFTALTAG